MILPPLHELIDEAVSLRNDEGAASAYMFLSRGRVWVVVAESQGDIGRDKLMVYLSGIETAIQVIWGTGLNLQGRC